jgi:uncharacterized membrane protein YbaN (DUF454 family)
MTTGRKRDRSTAQALGEPKAVSERLTARMSVRALRMAYLALGMLMLVLAFIGALLPLMPTTIFLILAVGCFARSSPRLEAWILDHPRFGPTVRAWREEGAIPMAAKIMAVSGMIIGYAVFFFSVRPGLLLGAAVAAVILACGIYVGSETATCVSC